MVPTAAPRKKARNSEKNSSRVKGCKLKALKIFSGSKQLGTQIKKAGTIDFFYFARSFCDSKIIV
jgi:hypothetical protein